MTEPEDFQERHSRTVPYTVVISRSPKREMAQCRRRAHDARLLDGLTDAEAAAFDEIAEVREWWHMRLHCTTAKAQRFERVDGGNWFGGFMPPRLDEHRLSKTFMDWSRLIVQDPDKKMDFEAIVAIISEGCGVKQMDRDRRKYNGWARRNLGLGLELWCELRGWA